MRRAAIAAWVVFLLACAVVVSRTNFTTDVSAFLPRSPTPVQELLVEQLREGAVSRLMLIAIEGAPQDALAQASLRLAAALRRQDAFVAVDNGDVAGSAADRDFIWRHRYLLSAAVAPERFTPAGLRERLEEYLRLLGSPAGPLVRRVLPADPSGELLEVLERIEEQVKPATFSGVWFSRDGARALLVAQTRAAGYDIDGQERALAQVRGEFAREAAASGAKLVVTGPGVFSVQSRAEIKGDALRFSLIATALIAAMLLALFRSPRVLVLGLLPVASGALTGVAAVSLGFGTVHGITLGFGVTLIGESVDYAIYLFTQSTPAVPPERALDRIWPTLRLGVLTSTCGFGAMLFSGFSGLAQLGLFSIAGLIAAAAVTRWVLPALLPAGFTATAAGAFIPMAVAVVRRAPVLRYPLLLAVALAAAVMLARGEQLWSDDLASLSPVPRADQQLDQQLRRDIGAPDVRYLVVINAVDEETVLQASESVGAELRGAMRAGQLEGYESPSTWLPSRRAQQARRDALPETQALRSSLSQALHALPYRSGVFEPFFKDVAAARNMPFITRDSLAGTRLALKVDTLLVSRERGWVAMLPLRGVSDANAVGGRLAAQPGAVLLDLKGESERLYRGYRAEALANSLLGAIAILVLLFASLRSPRRVFDVVAPLAAAVLVTACTLALAGYRLSIFHLVGLLLVVAVGSNYSLFFDRQAPSGGDRERTIVSLFFACVSTVIGFGLLAFSSVPVLHAIGSTVGMGAVLALVFSAILSRRREHAS